MSEPVRKRVLVVDDDRAILDLITTRLEIAGYQTFFARDGVEGLARLYELRPAALVVDVNMPKLDGFGLLRKMKLEGLLDRTPTMVLTARNQPDDVRLAIELGARDFLTKPFRDNQLISRVGRLVHKPPASRPSSSLPPVLLDDRPFR
jgi:two-component system OmpR family response regulator